MERDSNEDDIMKGWSGIMVKPINITELFFLVFQEIS